jgi:uncharacterized membrane protein YeaQ/YmgE (transglycosylase-associated protein family)
MAIEALIISFIVGAIAGWVASLVKAGGFGLIGDIILGVIGAVVGGWQLPQLIGGPILGSIINAFIGAGVVLLVLRPLIRPA